MFRRVRGSGARPARRSAWAALDLAATAQEFLARSIERDRRRRGVLVGGALLLSAVILVVSSIAFAQTRTAGQRERMSTARRLTAQADAVRQSDPTLAVKLALAAAQISPGAETKASLVNVLGLTRFEGTLWRDSAKMRAVAYSPSVRRPALAFGGKRGAGLVDLTRERPAVHTLAGTARANSVAFSPDGTTLAVGTESPIGSVVLWNVSDPAHPVRLGAPLDEGSGVNQLAFSGDGRTLAVGGGDETPSPSLWRLSPTRPPHRLPFAGARRALVHSLAFAPDGQTLAVERGNQGIDVWTIGPDEQAPRPRARLALPISHPIGVLQSISFSPDGSRVAVASLDRHLYLWRLDGLSASAPTDIDAGISLSSVAFAPGGRTLAAAGDKGTILMWDLSDQDHPSSVGAPLSAHFGTVQSVSFSADGSTLASASDDGRVMIWDLLERSRPPTTFGTPGPLPATGLAEMVESPRGPLLVRRGAAGDGAVDLWDTSGTQPRLVASLGTGPSAPVSAVALSPEGTVAALGDTDNTVTLWRYPPRTGHRSLGPALTGATAAITSVGFSRDGHLLAIASADGTATVWDVADPDRPRQLGPPLKVAGAAVSAVAWSPGRDVLAAGSGRDGWIRRWDFTDEVRPVAIKPALIGPTKAINALTFSPDGTALAAASDDNGVWLWDVDAAESSPAGRRLAGPGSAVNSVAFAPDGSSIAAGSNDFNVTIWDLTDEEDPRVLGRPLSGPARPVHSVRYSPSGDSVLGVSDDHVLTRWDITALNQLRTDPENLACRRTDKGLAPDEWTGFVPHVRYRNDCP